MRRRYEHPQPPQGRADLAWIGGGRRGAWWQSQDGLRVRLAAADETPRVDRARLSVVTVLLALIASGGGNRR